MRLVRILGEWSDSGFAERTQILTLKNTDARGRIGETGRGGLHLAHGLPALAEGGKQSVTHEHQVSHSGAGTCNREYLRLHPEVKVANPVKLLPQGRSAYGESEAKLVVANGGKVKVNVSRDLRLLPGEHEKIMLVLSGYERPDCPRGLKLQGGNALLTMYLLIVNSGIRLQEAFTLRRQQVDLDSKLVRVQTSTQWRGKVVYRDVPMRAEVYTALVGYLATRPMLPNAWFFPFLDEPGGKSLHTVSSRLSARFRIAFEYIGIMGLHEHDLRHEATCRWLELKDARGNWMLRLEQLNRIMGWKPDSGMSQRYASFKGEDLAARLWALPSVSLQQG